MVAGCLAMPPPSRVRVPPQRRHGIFILFLRMRGVRCVARHSRRRRSKTKPVGPDDHHDERLVGIEQQLKVLKRRFQQLAEQSHEVVEETAALEAELARSRATLKAEFAQLRAENASLRESALTFGALAERLVNAAKRGGS